MLYRKRVANFPWKSNTTFNKPWAVLGSIDEDFRMNTILRPLNNKAKRYLEHIAKAVLWTLWMEKNKRVTQHGQENIHEIVTIEEVFCCSRAIQCLQRSTFWIFSALGIGWWLNPFFCNMQLRLKEESYILSLSIDVLGFMKWNSVYIYSFMIRFSLRGLLASYSYRDVAQWYQDGNLTCWPL